MNLLNRKTFKCCFGVVCAIVVAFMVGYWLYKYEIEDRDIGVVDYTQLKDEKDIEFPAISLCIEEPYLDEKLKAIIPEISKCEYNYYLGGEVFYNSSYEQIDYANVTVDLRLYFQSAAIRWQNGTLQINMSDSISHHEVFNGFSNNFLKCFMISYTIEDQRQIRTLTLSYDLMKLKKDWQALDGSHVVHISAHYPGQFFLENEFTTINLDDHQFLIIKFKEYEIIKRRNSRHRKCLDVTATYDNIMINQLVVERGCRVPYLKGYRSHPMCNTTKKIQDGKIDTDAQLQMNISKACQRISKIRVNVEKSQFTNLTLVIHFPREVKVITQSKDVDIHSLIGNIGGYLGLFLGKNYH